MKHACIFIVLLACHVGQRIGHHNGRMTHSATTQNTKYFSGTLYCIANLSRPKWITANFSKNHTMWWNLNRIHTYTYTYIVIVLVDTTSHINTIESLAIDQHWVIDQLRKACLSNCRCVITCVPTHIHTRGRDIHAHTHTIGTMGHLHKAQQTNR